MMATNFTADLPPFNPDEDPSSTPQRWKSYLRKLERALVAWNIKDDSRMASILLHCGGDKLDEIEQTLTYDKTEGSVFANLSKALTDHFEPKRNVTFSTYQFYQMKQEEGEGIDAFVTRLRNQAAMCDFQDVDRRIKDQIVFRCLSKKVRNKALTQDLSLKDLLAEARCQETAQREAGEIEKGLSSESTEKETFRVSRQPGKYSARLRHPGPDPKQQPPQRNSYQQQDKAKSFKNFNDETRGTKGRNGCDFCIGPKHPRDECPANGKTCFNCGGTGHFSARCKSGRQVRQLERDEDGRKDTGSDVESDCDSHFAYRVTAVNALNCDTDTDNFPMILNEQKMRFCLDTGSHGDIIPVKEYERMNPKPELESSDQKFRAYGSKTTFESKGKFVGHLRASEDGRLISSEIHVVDLPGKTCCLLSKRSCKALGLITFNLPREVNSVSSPSITDLISEFLEVFDGRIGCHKEIKVSLPMDQDVTPVSCPPTRHPIHLLPAIEAEIKRLEDAGVIEDVPIDCTNQWVNRLVPVPRKIEGSDKPGIRLTIDWRNVNKGLEQVHHEIPSVENLCYDLNGAVYFSDLDMNDAFSQLPLDDESKKLTTFSTPRGLKRLTRLVQGAKPSAAIFHETLRRDLQGIPNQLNIADNIIVWGTGATDEEARRNHFENLRKVLEVLKRKGWTLSKRKCKFEQKSIKFFGFIFSADGRSPDPEKVEAVKKADRPGTKEEAMSWLGMVGFNLSFIPNFSTITEPIRRLTVKNVLYIWTEEQQRAYNTVTECLVETCLLSYFSPKRKSVVVCDGSPVGVQATLFQKDEVGNLCPIFFASRSLNETERRYSQIEREAVALQFGCHRFHCFLFGASFDLFTDSASLKPMIENPRKSAPARIERLRLKMQGYDAKIHVIRGKYNPADYISRHPLPYKNCSKEEKQNARDVENHVYYLTKLLPDAITTTRIRETMVEDPVLLKVRSLLTNDRDPSLFDKKLREFVKPYLNVWDELSVGNGLVLRGERLVLPKTLYDDAVNLSHEGHQGDSKSKQYLRASVWFAGMDKLIEKKVKSCIPCQASTPMTSAQPLLMSELPSEPWQILAADLFGPLPTGERVLVLKCLRSKWPELKVFLRNQSTNAESVISAMEAIFTIHGIPEEIMTDNGPPFNSNAFSAFAKKSGFHHRKITPLWPQANGQAENFMKSLGKTIRTAVVERRDWKKALDEFLLSYRATPHPSTGASPAAVMFPGRRYKTKLPACPTQIDPNTIQSHFDKQQSASKAYTDNRRNAIEPRLKVGDNVLVRQSRRNKFTTPFYPDPLEVTKIKGSMVTASGKNNITRNHSHFKKIDLPVKTKAAIAPAQKNITFNPHPWRRWPPPEDENGELIDKEGEDGEKEEEVRSEDGADIPQEEEEEEAHGADAEDEEDKDEESRGD